MDPELFWTLTDDVLIATGRNPLDPQGPERRVIAVQPEDRVLQILAGPGSGKTETLVWRVLYELFLLRRESHRLLVTTFTRKAATELTVRLVERCDALLTAARRRGLDLPDPRVHDLRVGTIHGLCDTLLAEFDEEYIAAGTRLIDEVETRIRIARGRRRLFGQPPSPSLLERLRGYEELVALFRPPWFEDERWPSSVMDTADWLLGLLAQHTETWIPRRGASGGANGVELIHGVRGLTDDLVEAQRLWEEALNHRSLLDFTTLQKRFLEQQDRVSPHIDHVFVDEFQDTNPAQYALHTAWLNREAIRLTVVGDDDQALYRFRGSDIECFQALDADCASRGVAYRREVLEVNYRGTPSITGFAQRFRASSALGRVSMPKDLKAPAGEPAGTSVRLLRGPWHPLCTLLADEIAGLGPRQGASSSAEAPAVAVLMFSTSEKGSSPALSLRLELESRGLRAYNPRNKVAGRAGSPVHDLLALVSYLIDPVTLAATRPGGRTLEVHATHLDAKRVPLAITAPPENVRVSPKHVAIQKRFVKSHGRIGEPDPVSAPLLSYVDDVRDGLAAAAGAGRQPRLSLAGFVARLLSFERFRRVGFTIELFREALFTTLLEANIAPTRMSQASLDRPLAPSRGADGKIVWPDEFWTVLSFLGMLIADVDLDDVEVEAFAEDAVALLTFHQAKGLEFDHVYVGMTGRQPSANSVLRTKLFSGDAVPYTVTAGAVQTTDVEVVQLAEADRDREVYVALTRARSTLTFFDAPGHGHPLMGLHQGIESLFERFPEWPLDGVPQVSVTEASYDVARA